MQEFPAQGMRKLCQPKAGFAPKIARFTGAAEKNEAILPKNGGIANEISFRVVKAFKRCWKN
jgi:hypothetical protein